MTRLRWVGSGRGPRSGERAGRRGREREGRRWRESGRGGPASISRTRSPRAVDVIATLNACISSVLCTPRFAEFSRLEAQRTAAARSPSARKVVGRKAGDAEKENGATVGDATHQRVRERGREKGRWLEGPILILFVLFTPVLCRVRRGMFQLGRCGWRVEEASCSVSSTEGRTLRPVGGSD